MLKTEGKFKYIGGLLSGWDKNSEKLRSQMYSWACLA